MNFPAATSPVKSASCTTLGTAGGTATDAIANLAYEFGDANDGVSSASGTAAAVDAGGDPRRPSRIKCVKTAATGSAGGLTSGHPTLTLKVKTGTVVRHGHRRPAGWA